MLSAVLGGLFSDRHTTVLPTMTTMYPEPEEQIDFPAASFLTLSDGSLMGPALFHTSPELEALPTAASTAISSSGTRFSSSTDIATEIFIVHQFSGNAYKHPKSSVLLLPLLGRLHPCSLTLPLVTDSPTRSFVPRYSHSADGGVGVFLFPLTPPSKPKIF